ncbi:DUF4355 domain-containing protein [Ligilactobacillus murinus]|uniref:DUF4355 domain-containing protein n=1 Tax=Ligilactobacillus murinus TaxID=1622 RepID=UPI001C8C4C67|nr:DUF4355 domain-containing protein [Ligilactobacillus murinus]MBX9012653.1 DUF4355 domain-containing protein [Ligilactobacillus murinus]
MEKELLLLDLQRFAEGEQSGEGDATDEQQSSENVEQKTEPFKTFETESEMDSFFDKKLSKALETARTNWQKEQEEQAKNAKERKNMTEEQRREYDFKQREQALSDREAEIAKRENKSKLANQLIQDGLPAGLVDVFGDVLADEDTMNASYQKVSEAFRGALHDAVETRLAQSARTPKSTEGNAKLKTVGEMYAEKANESNKSKSDFWK